MSESRSIAWWCAAALLCQRSDRLYRSPRYTLFPLQVEKELQEICISILDLLDNHLIPSASTGESKVFYYKMKGDYHRYLAEFKTQEQREESAKHTLEAYKKAQVRVVNLGSRDRRQVQRSKRTLSKSPVEEYFRGILTSLAWGRVATVVYRNHLAGSGHVVALGRTGRLLWNGSGRQHFGYWRVKRPLIEILG